MKNTVFLVAMDYEIENIFDLNRWEELTSRPFRILEHKKKKYLKIVRMGVGKSNSAAATQYSLIHLCPARIINLGLVGCINKKLEIGEIRAASECRFFDVDVTPFDHELGQVFQCELVSYKLRCRGNKKTAKVISGDSFITDQSEIADIISIFQPDFIDMELGAIAHTLHINDKLNILESYKAPSDYSDSSAKKDFFENEKRAFSNLRNLALSLKERI